MPEDAGRFELPIVFTGVEDVPIYFANHFVVQHQGDEFFIIVGQVTPPILLGTVDDQRRQASQLTHVPVNVVARIGMNKHRLTELVKILQENLATRDKERLLEGAGE